jgi:hypothetical protein
MPLVSVEKGIIVGAGETSSIEVVPAENGHGTPGTVALVVFRDGVRTIALFTADEAKAFAVGFIQAATVAELDVVKHARNPVVPRVLVNG